MTFNPTLISLTTAAVMAIGVGSVAAQNTCNGTLSIEYAVVQTPNVVGSVDTVRLILGAGSIVGGTALNVSQIYFDLDCKNRVCSTNLNQGCSVSSECPGGGTCDNILPVCIDDGAVAGYAGNITTTCAGVTWSANSAGGAIPNKVIFTATPAVSIPAGESSFCTLEFDFVKLASTSNDSTPMTIEQVTGFQVAMCDNSLSATGATSGGVTITVPQPDTVPAPTASLSVLLLMALSLAGLGFRRVRRTGIA